MICRCFGKTLDLRLLKQTAELMLGVPDYEAYCSHMETIHSDRPVLTRDQFYRARQEARFGSVLRCC